MSNAMSSPAAGKPIPMFLDSSSARARLGLALRASALFWGGALVAWLIGADIAVFQGIAQSPVLKAWRPLGEAYSDWAPYIFYLPFLAAILIGMQRKHTLLKTIGYAYVLAQLFGTALLVRLCKLVFDRPRPYAAYLQDGLNQLTDVAQAVHSSFPSTHTVDMTVGAILTAVVLRSRAASSLAVCAAVLMAASRVLVGRHYLSDVLAGLGLGVAIVGLTMHVYLLPRWRKIESAQTP